MYYGIVLCKALALECRKERLDGLHDGFPEGTRPCHILVRYIDVARSRVKFALVHRKKNRLYVRFSAKNCDFCKFCEFCEFCRNGG